MAAANTGDSQYGGKPHCPICLDKFTTPRQLPCLHSFCQVCLEDYISSKVVNVKEPKDFECPTCRTVVPVSRKGKTSQMWASLFPINTILQSIGHKEKEEVDRPCDCCLSDGVSVTANWFCVVCEEAMCESCQKVHQKQKATKDHSIVTMKERTNNPSNIIRFHKGFRCQEHEEEDLKFYCRDHMNACCASCCIIHHRNCGQVLDLRKDGCNLLMEVKPLRVLEEMKKLEYHLMNFEKRNDSYIISLESQVQEMTNKIKEIRRKINDLLDDLERKVKSEGNQLYKQEAIRKQEDNRECQALLNAVRNSHVILETVIQHGSDAQIFIMADRTISQVKLYYEQIKEKFEKTETVTLNLQVDPQLQSFLGQRSNIGKIVCRKEHEIYRIVRPEKPLKDYPIKIQEVVEINVHGDQGRYYTGLTYLQDDQVMLTDFNNKRVLLLNSSYQCIARLTLPDSPWDICVVDHKEVVISLPSTKTLQFLSVTSGSIKLTRRVETRYKCRGVAPAGIGKIVVSSSTNSEGKCYWSLISSTGEEEMCHQFNCQIDNSCTYTALSSSCTRVYITVCLANSLYCFSMDGRIMFVYSPDSLRLPTGVAIDRDDNVYVVAYGSHSIHQLTSDGVCIRVITEGFPDTPTAICFNNSRDKFAITNHSGYSRKIYMFCFK